MDGEWVEYDGGVVQDWHRNARRIRVARGVAVIPEWAFNHCNLREVDLGNVTTISAHALYNCRWLERVVRTSAFAVEFGTNAFYGCESLSEIDLSNVTKIGLGAFHGCKALRRVDIPSSVAAIEDVAFHDCSGLAEVKLGEGIRRIGEAAFSSCHSLARISIPASVTDIEYAAFDGCSSLGEVELNEGLQRIGKGAFNGCTSLLRIEIPSTTLNVGDHAFYQCRQLRNAELQEGLQTIGEQAFWSCCCLEHITIPSSVTFIGSRAFGNCSNLSQVTLREGVHRFEFDAFYGCGSLAHINISPVALVIDVMNVNISSRRLLRATMPKQEGRTLVVSKWMQYRSPEQLEQAETKVNEILGRPRHVEERIRCIREWFAYCNLLDVTTLLELAIWRVNVDGNEQGAEVRQAIRERCGNDMNVIIPSVLQFLDV